MNTLELTFHVYNVAAVCVCRAYIINDDMITIMLCEPLNVYLASNCMALSIEMSECSVDWQLVHL